MNRTSGEREHTRRINSTGVVYFLSMNQSYTGGCHCGAVRYTVNMELKELMSCNCSICSKGGWLLAFVPASQFTLESGQDALTDYQFGKKQLHHLFCKHCGVRSFSRGAGPDGQEMIAVNARCLDNTDLSGLSVTEFNGKDL